MSSIQQIDTKAGQKDLQDVLRELPDEPVSISLGVWDIWTALLDRTINKALSEGTESTSVLVHVAQNLNNCETIEYGYLRPLC